MARALAAQLLHLCLLWKRAALRGIGSWTALNSMPGFVGRALSGFAAPLFPAQAPPPPLPPLQPMNAPEAVASTFAAPLGARIAAARGYAVPSLATSPLLWQASVAAARGRLHPGPASQSEARAARGRKGKAADLGFKPNRILRVE